jgi:proline iminopeptidase
VLSAETGGATNPYGDRPSLDALALVRSCSRYFSRGAWLEEGVLLREAHRLAGIPGVLIHGRLDLGGPLQTAWQLHPRGVGRMAGGGKNSAWPESRLIVVEGAGHLGTVTTRGHVVEALDGLATGW